MPLECCQSNLFVPIRETHVPIQKGFTPRIFFNFFSLINEVHGYNTRGAKLYCLPLCRTNIRQFSIKYQGPNFFNTLSFDIRNSSSVSSFNSQLRKYLLCYT